MPAEVVVMYDCASNFAEFEVRGTDDLYRVIMGGETYVDCINKTTGQQCRGFKFRKNCSHIKRVWDGACLYNPQWRDGKQDPALVPVVYDQGFGFNESVRCPFCGGPSRAVRRAV